MQQPTTNDSDWFLVVDDQFSNHSGVTALTTNGQYQWLRVQITVPGAQINSVPVIVSGTVDKILVLC